MSPAELVRSLEDAGVRLRIVGGRLDLEAATEPPAELLDELARRKAEVLRFLRERETPPPPVSAGLSMAAQFGRLGITRETRPQPIPEPPRRWIL